MKKFFYLLLISAALVSCGEAVMPVDGEYGPYTVTTIAENVYHIEDCNASRPAGQFLSADGTMQLNNCSDMYLVVGKNRALLIDLSNKISWADNAEESIRQIVDERVRKCEKIITVTHNHGDHTGMAYAFTEDSTVSFWLPRIDFEKNKIFPSERSTFFDDKDQIDLGGGCIVSAVTVPGHTAGSTVFFVNGQNIAFTGDAVGSGGGVWLFAPESLETYENGLDNLVGYIENTANGIDSDKLVLWGGHYWQRVNGGLEKLGMQYLYDMQKLVDQIKAGEASWEPYNHARLSANFKYGTATITWSIESATELYGQK